MLYVFIYIVIAVLAVYGLRSAINEISRVIFSKYKKNTTISRKEDEKNGGE